MLIGSKIHKKRYYKEVDSLVTTYILKFKMDRLNYLLSFDDSGKLKISGFRVNEIDVPEEIFQNIIMQLSSIFDDPRIRRIFQQYPNDTSKTSGTELKNTFQNLLLPSNIYHIMVIGKKEGRKEEYDLWFNAEGDLIRKRLSLPANYDHVLY